jgi:hypothetical protein
VSLRLLDTVTVSLLAAVVLRRVLGLGHLDGMCRNKKRVDDELAD